MRKAAPMRSAQTPSRQGIREITADALPVGRPVRQRHDQMQLQQMAGDHGHGDREVADSNRVACIKTRLSGHSQITGQYSSVA
jgi:hypothetical protein